MILYGASVAQFFKYSNIQVSVIVSYFFYKDSNIQVKLWMLLKTQAEFKITKLFIY